jgi:hypothetical protein
MNLNILIIIFVISYLLRILLLNINISSKEILVITLLFIIWIYFIYFIMNNIINNNKKYKKIYNII